MIASRLSFFKSGNFRHIGFLAGGTAIAQLLTVIALPFLTRIYSPDDFSALAVFLAITGIITVASCLRLEMAIPLADDDVEAANIMGLCFITVSAISVITFIALNILFEYESFNAKLSQLRGFAWLIPLGVLLSGTYLALQFWSTRRQNFSLLAQTKITQAGAGLATQSALGLASWGALGLVIGQVVMAGGGILSILRRLLRDDRPVMRQMSWKGMRQAAVKYRRFPQYSTLEALANEAALQLPILLIAALANAPEAGYLMLAMRALGTPVTLIGGAVKQVFTSQAPEAYRKGALSDLTTTMLTNLVRVGIAPLILAAIIAPGLFAFVFGDNWRQAGYLVAWMTPWFIFKLLSAPVSIVMHVQMKQKTMLLLMIAGLIINVGGTLGAYHFYPSMIVHGYAISASIYYFIAFLIYTKHAQIRWKELTRVFKVAIIPVAAAVILGTLYNLILNPWISSLSNKVTGL